MAILPVAMGAQLLGIHPKTLHCWLGEANFSLAPHPRDARIKCVAEEHLLELARRHGRPLPDLPSESGSPGEQAKLWPAREAELAHSAALLPAPSAFEADLIQRLASLETRTGTLQEHLAQLAVALLHERERTVESRIAALEALVQALMGRDRLPYLPEQEAKQASPDVLPRERRLLPAEQRARSRMPTLIEYGAQGTYVIITSQEGEVHLVPDSPEWFEWLATISSLRFVGQQGRFTAHRDTKHGSPTRSWRAYRTIHQRNYKLSLGVTDDLTLACLEQAAATFQSHVPAL